MTLLAGTAYDPAVAVSQSTAALKAMTALDTTNLRLTFTAPANGIVLVRLKGQILGATTWPRIQLGILDGSTLRGRATPSGATPPGVATQFSPQEVSYVITGLTPGNSYTWDAAYGVDIVVASTNLKYGGPNDSSGADAFGAFHYEIWSTENLLAGTFYDPLTSVTTSTTSLLGMTALDTTNLRLTFTAPSSGNVMWRVRGQVHGATTPGQILLGVLQSSTVIGRSAPPLACAEATGSNTSCLVVEATGIVTGLSGSYTWDAAYAVQVVANAGGFAYGGPNNATTNDCFGGAAFEVWAG